MRQAITFLSALFALALALAADLPAIEVVGNKFFYANNGSQFLIRGIAYQQNTENSTSSGDSSYTDPLADGDACKRDVEYFAKSNTNVLRVYAVDPTKDHDECMNTFADAGIYIIADLSEPDTSINRDSPEWNLELYDRYTSVIDMFANYTNVLGFFAGNEVTNNKSNTDASAFVKAAVRDMKTYVKDNGWSYPVGYSSNDDADTRVAIADYFSCGDLDERADFFGINMYEWCGDSTFEESGYKDRTEEYLNLTIPVFFSEYGCNLERPRKFTEIATLFSDEMTDVWSGGIVYMYFEEENEYGLVSVSDDTVSTLADYSYYSKEMNSISPNLVLSSDIGSASTQTLACPTSASTWKASASLPPTPDKETCDCVYSSLLCVVADDVDTDDYSDLYGFVCGEIDCSAVSANGTTGVYGSVSFCSDKEKLSYVLNAYYEDQDSHSSACDFDGSATLVASASVASSCSAAVSSVSANAVATGSSSSSTSSASSSTSTKSSDGKIAALPATKSELVAIGAMISCIVGGFGAFFF
ncbi:hypothetical protein METBIDRAFT_39075 [Metschnikowia bicuspidata var. bicuspidata NRRL YB-4993]|uniref:1,3-beta-glucanosyltransferase n=1 Tax=Metschnikowia bicuspidata var. bicuspidata NRRL YB-4993 TaxID=869754 RepID=A0A1A0HD56_9ASCO|nr:hypothetical protein METBIDRAFT_39075 [Metschnikowia bicuspidata var. bicuspidata NRRL YB-4993]OBA22014.1 hypothetical protein METBIDRAFT_39075 [Metschnikowia bicuspidata var. bicuspidata NRRL YB-4993]